MQNEIDVPAILNTILKVGKRVQCFETEKEMQSQNNEEMLQQSSLIKMHQNGEKMTLIDT